MFSSESSNLEPIPSTNNLFHKDIVRKIFNKNACNVLEKELRSITIIIIDAN